MKNKKAEFVLAPGYRLKKYLEDKGFTQKQIASTIGILPSQINEVLNARRPITAAFILALQKGIPDLDCEYWVIEQSKYELFLLRQLKNYNSK